jgi:SAM-dependent methyltransferase
MLWQYWQPKSVVDIGCGTGAWLKAALDLGAEESLGIDGEYVGRAELLIDAACFRPFDLTERLDVGKRFDLAISVEVAEHLPLSRAESFIADLTELSDVVLFSAALPYQGGVNHVNEQWLEFWAILFRKWGYAPFDIFRQRVWAKKEVEVWYSQNVMLFCKGGPVSRLFPEEALASDRPLSFPHPLLFLTNITRYRPLSPQALEAEWLDYRSLLEAYLSGGIAHPPLSLPLAKGLSDGGEVSLFPEARTQILDVPSEVARYRSEIERLSRCVAEQQTAAEALRAEVWRVSNELSQSKDRIGGLSADLMSRESEIRRLCDEIAARDGSLEELRRSLSWRVTEPLRRAGALLPGADRFLRFLRKTFR